MTDASRPAVRVEHLSLGLAGGTSVVEDVSFSLEPGQILGLVGESGSGKTTTALALLGYTRPGVVVRTGTVEVGGHAVLGRDRRGLRDLRGKVVSYVPQDPGGALNPSLRVGDAIGDVLRAHRRGAPGESVRAALERVELAGGRIASSYPHQLSGGQQQRVSIAMACVCEPPVAVLDEPTTGLDVLTQDRILTELSRLRDEHRMAMVYVSHDLAVVGRMADRIAVMYAGRIVEEGPTADVLARPRHPYTRALVAAIPDFRRPRALRGIPGVAVGVGEWPPGCAFAARCDHQTAQCCDELPALDEVAHDHVVRCCRWRELDAAAAGAAEGRTATVRDPSAPILQVEDLEVRYRGRGERAPAVSGVSFTIAPGTCVALVGESGSGKTTIGRCVAGLHEPTAGRIRFDDAVLAGTARARTLDQRRRIQIIFQNPFESLNPRHRVAASIERPLRILRGLSRADAAREVGDLLERVRLPRRVMDRFPVELSGGERQRVAIARALAPRPELLVCDEVTSALDVSVQAAVLELLSDLQRELRLGMLFITHNLGVVACVADTVLVIDRGSLCENGAVDRVLTSPRDDYTRRLLDAAPTLPDAGEAA